MKKRKQKAAGQNLYQKHSFVKKIKFTTFLQSLYFTNVFYFSNDLFSYASACAFGFLFSFIPVVMMILVILLRFLHASPEMITSILNSSSIFSSTFDIKHMIDSVTSIKTVTNFEVVLGLAIIWMARRFFSSIMAGMRAIFKQATPPKPLVSQIVILAGEAIFVIAAASIMFVVISFNTIRHTSFFSVLENQFPILPSTMVSTLLNTIPLFFIFIIVLFCYKFESRSNPKWSLCMFASMGCTFCFWVFQNLMGLFINVNRYNLIYGVLSNIIVLLLEVYFFFMLFLFFAQLIFVQQFFDDLLLGELYVLPKREDTNFFSTLKRILFIKPEYLLLKNVNVIHCKKGEFIYKMGDSGMNAYYIVHGSIEISRENNISYLEKGSFFGEEACILDQARKEDAIANTDVEIVQISGRKFLSLLDKNPAVSKKALAQISTYFSKVYGRKDEFRL